MEDAISFVHKTHNPQLIMFVSIVDKSITGMEQHAHPTVQEVNTLMLPRIHANAQ